MDQDSAPEFDTEEAAAEEKMKSAEAEEDAAKPVVKPSIGLEIPVDGMINLVR